MPRRYVPTGGPAKAFCLRILGRARPLRRAIQQRIENPLSKLLLEGKFPPKSTIPVDVDPIQNPGVFSFDKVGKTSKKLEI